MPPPHLEVCPPTRRELAGSDSDDSDAEDTGCALYAPVDSTPSSGALLRLWQYPCILPLGYYYCSTRNTLPGLRTPVPLVLTMHAGARAAGYNIIY